MGSINLKSELTRAHSRSSGADNSQPVPKKDEYTFKDIRMDIQFASNANNLPANSSPTAIDLEDLRDLQAIKQSIKNIFNTMPGQRLLNPKFGLNLAAFLFEPVNRITADTIARAIYFELPRQEPRIELDNISVMGDVDQGQYDVSFVITTSQKNMVNITVNGALTSDGFKFTEI